MKTSRLPRLLWILPAVFGLVILAEMIGPGAKWEPENFSKQAEYAAAAQPLNIPTETQEPEVSFWVVRAYFDDPAMVSKLAQWLEPWEVRRDLGYLVVGVTQEQLILLEQAGFRVVIDEKLTEKYNKPALSLPDQENGIPGLSLLPHSGGNILDCAVHSRCVPPIG